MATFAVLFILCAVLANKLTSTTTADLPNLHSITNSSSEYKQKGEMNSSSEYKQKGEMNSSSEYKQKGEMNSSSEYKQKGEMNSSSEYKQKGEMNSSSEYKQKGEMNSSSEYKQKDELKTAEAKTTQNSRLDRMEIVMEVLWTDFQDSRRKEERVLKENKQLREMVRVLQNQMTAYSHSGVSEKRSDDTVLEPVVQQLSQRLDSVTAELQALKNQVQSSSTGGGGGTTYTRWGHAACPNTSDTVYSGAMGGGRYENSGSAVNYLCLPDNPIFDQHANTVWMAEMSGAEYDTKPEPDMDMTPTCAVCHIPRSSTVMIPATNVCQPGWRLDYSGYLMTGYPTHASSHEYICVDSSQGYRLGTQGNENGALLYYTQAHCGSLSCPPYVEGKIVLCVVCSK